jgi:Sec-independent protein translocase protein TatA
MTFLGIGPGELFLLLIIMLVVVGPERLPGFARQAGKMIVGLRNWIQRSPDAQLFLRARDELETELRTIRDDLAQEMETVRQEMQTVREEVIQATREATVDAARQLDDAAAAAREASAAAQQIQEATQTVRSAADDAVEQIDQAVEAAQEKTLELEEAVQQIDQVAEVAQEQAAELAEAAQATASAAEPTLTITPPDPTDELAPMSIHTIAPPRPAEPPALTPNGMPVPRSSKPNAPPPAQPESDAARMEIEALKEQIAGVTAELRALQEQFQQIRAGLRTADSAAEPAPQPEEVAP